MRKIRTPKVCDEEFEFKNESQEHLSQGIQEWTKLWKIDFKKPYHRPYHFKFFKGCLPQVLLGPFLKSLTHLSWKTIFQSGLVLFVKFLFFFNSKSFARLHWRLLTNLKASTKVFEAMFFYMYRYIISESLFNTLYIKIQKFSLGQKKR